MSAIKRIQVSQDFAIRLANRDKYQGDGKHNAIEFRQRFLSELDKQEAWDTGDVVVELDFTGVRKMGPSFANEAFAFFTKYANPTKVKSKIHFHNMSRVQKLILDEELECGYSGK